MAGKTTHALCTPLGNCVVVIVIGPALIGLAVAQRFGAVEVVGAVVIIGGLLARLATMLAADVPT